MTDESEVALVGFAACADLQRTALRLWWDRETCFPARIRRAPDSIDLSTGAWGHIVSQAKRLMAEEATGRLL